MRKKIALASIALFLLTPFFAFGASVCVTISSSLSLGSTGPQVTALQFYFTQVYEEFTQDHVIGTFDAFTESALQQWQSEHGIASSGTPETTGWGVVGPRTRKALSCSVQNSQSSGSASPSAAATTSISTPVINSNAGSSLSIGSTGPAVLEVQQVLIAQGLLSSDSATGYFGPLTQAAVRAFQATNGIVSSGSPSSTGYGAVGPRTIAAIHAKQTSGGIQAIQGNQNTPPFGTVITPPAPIVSNASCSIAGLSMPSGSSLVFYSQFSLLAGGDCSQFSQVRQCINGALTGGSQYQYAACAALQNAQQCNVNGTLIQNGASATLYSQPSIGYGGSCGSISQVRTCSNGVMSGSYQYTYPSCAVSNPNSCLIGGSTMTSGSSGTFYSQQTVPFGSSCATVAQSRTCNNGSLDGSGNYQYPICTPVTTSSCTLDGQTTTTGSSKTFYSASTVAYGTTCAAASQSRKCTNGVLDGSDTYSHGTCTVAAPSSCVLDGVTVAHGASHSFYTSSSVAFGQACPAAVTRTCTNGTLNGSPTAINASCSVGAAASCTLDGATVPSGSSRTFYFQKNVPAGSSCTSYGVSRTCTNGTLSGGTTQAAYAYSSCATASGGTCALDNTVVANGATNAFYSLAAPPTGQLCSAFKLNRTCTNGSLDGNTSFNRSSCVDSTSCTLGGVTIPSGNTASFYSAQSVAYNASCSTVAQSRTCTNGSLSGGSTSVYKYGSCTPATPLTCTLDTVTLSSGNSASFYSTKTVPFGTTCESVSQARTCINGTLNGTVSYKYGSCTVTPPSNAAACVLDSVAVQSGSSGTFYSVQTAPIGKLCSAYDQSRLCTNGTMGGTGTYKYASCTDSAACTLDGTTVQSGASATFYTATISNNCAGIGLLRTCTNGSLSGSTSYSNAACRATRITVIPHVPGGPYNAANPIPVGWSTDPGITRVTITLYKAGVAQTASPAISDVSEAWNRSASFTIGSGQTLGTDYTYRVKDSAAGGVAEGESPVFTIGYSTNPIIVTTTKTAYNQGENIIFDVSNASGITSGFHYSLINTDTQASIRDGTMSGSSSLRINVILTSALSGNYIVKIYTDTNSSVSGVSAPFTIGTVTASNSDKLSQLASAFQALEQLIQRLHATQ